MTGIIEKYDFDQSTGLLNLCKNHTEDPHAAARSFSQFVL
jgi:hypothetical protein